MSANHARIVEVLTPFVSEERRARIEQVLTQRLRRLCVVVEDVHEPHNAAAVVRTCEAMGLCDLHVIEGEERFSLSSRVTQGADQWLSIFRHRSVLDASRQLRARGFRLFGAVPDGDVELDALPTEAPLALVFGNEHRGLSDVARRDMEILFRIPMAGMTQSLNLSVAVAIAVHSVSSRLRTDFQGDLDESERHFLRAQWYHDSVAGADAILRRFAPELVDSQK